VNATTIPTPQQWADASWHARQQWADHHGLTLRGATHAVEAGHLQRREVVQAARRMLGDVYPLRPADTPDELEASFAGDGDPVVVALRRAAATGLPLTHHDVTANLPHLQVAS
jgi:hypothetical protein